MQIPKSTDKQRVKTDLLRQPDAVLMYICSCFLSSSEFACKGQTPDLKRIPAALPFCRLDLVPCISHKVLTFTLTVQDKHTQTRMHSRSVTFNQSRSISVCASVSAVGWGL